MASLILMFRDQVIKEFPFEQGTMTVGRQPENDIIIDNLAVSGHHAKVEKTDADFVLTDLGSTNGTFVNDRRIEFHHLSHGDNIQIGKHSIVFMDSAKEKAAEVNLDKTMMLDTASHRELLSKQDISTTELQRPEKIGMITFIDGSGLGEIELNKKLTRIGKSSKSEVRLSGLFLGATIATISKRPSGYTITYTGALTKLKVNGKVIRDSIRLKDFDTIEIGSHKFQFYEKAVKQP